MNCNNCNGEFIGNYCSNCGEKMFNKKDLSLKHFAEESFEGFVHFDNKFFRTLKTLLISPGQLSLDYINGKRVRYMKPVQSFLIINLIFFFFISNNIFSLSLHNYITYKPFINYNTEAIVKEKLSETGLSLLQYEQMFNEKINSSSKEFIFLYIPFYAICFSIIFLLKHRRFAEHLIFSTHFTAFIVAYFL